MSTTETATSKYVGTRVPRVEDLRLITGAGQFVDDVTRPGMLHATFVRSPIPRGKIVGIDVSEAVALVGVHAVYVAADLNPGVHKLRYAMDGADAPDTPWPPLADDEVRYVGDPVALVIAYDRYVAEDAAELVVVDYEELTPVINYETAEEATELVHPGSPNNLAGGLGFPADHLVPIFEGAAHVVEQTVYQQAYSAVPMETRGIVAEWSAPTGEMMIWASTQAPHEVRGVCARLFGIDEHRVRVIMRDTGGGFGQKVVPLREEICVMLAARKLPAAVKWIEDRQENLMASGMARQDHGLARIAFDADGKILAASIDHSQNVGAYPIPAPLTGAIAVGMLFPGPYRVPASGLSLKMLYTNTIGRVAYRGPWQFESMAREVLLDKAARTMGIDPVELRRRNMLSQAELPAPNPNGMPYSDMTPLETFNLAVETLDYEAFRAEQQQARADGRYIGVGTCTYVEPTAGAVPSLATEGATIRIEPSGKVNVYVAGGSSGNSIETTVVQLTADALGVDIADVNTIQGDTAITPYGGGTQGSRSGSMTAGAVAETAVGLRERILAIAAHKLNADVNDIEFVHSRATVRGVPDVELTLAEIAQIAYFQRDAMPPGVPNGLEASGRYTAEIPMVWANATHVCTCEVDIETGAVTLLRYIVGEDVGPMINPNVVEGQICGGTVQGVGGALFEHQAYDEAGNPIATTFMDYLMPTAVEAPTIEIAHLDTPSAGPGGHKGVGEGGAIGSAPAIVNAVADALAPFGIEISRLPLTPSKIVAMVDEARTRTVTA
ncbi:xanthine dehydrogenase family protein molybdopterin-binding subunit [Aldersonia kunmingensis]|uniref:xanthine dehydrogenase family protein molybdopterin-binding subunit n=1 Tax=Aldersonia kunmingensis TaxID=408066 RepID=UPI0008363722|nr:xanthine dehydrogenase family protein molybdopterin-binding subunit [Aldersonia kunmingensis]